MEQRKLKRDEPSLAVSTEQLLSTYYHQLLQWGSVLTRGDAGKAQEIVQEFCLYFTLTRPDLSEVSNLDGYLYTCLRHIYLSHLAKASREALRFVSIADFDSFDFAMSAKPSGDPLERQNDLRRVCGFMVWRKQQSKSASYFVLHFFHGYSRREIAEITLLPISAIYNKLKSAREEVKSHLDQSGRLRVASKDSPPLPQLSWSLISAANLFRELRQTILNARMTDCLAEEALLAYYRASTPNPIPCALLSHLVSCERCLDVLNRHFDQPALKDREALDGFTSTKGSNGPGSTGEMSMLRSVRRRWGQVHEHRPRTLSIAVNGRIVASHDVQSSHSMLSARIEAREVEQFVEVFSEQDVRLALIPVGGRPPQGPHTMMQRVPLSDARWLELNLTFDGLGLHGRVAYFDPALASDEAYREIDAVERGPLPAPGVAPRTSAYWRRFFGSLMPSPMMAWAMVLLLIVGAAGYLSYRHQGAALSVQGILNDSIQAEAAGLHDQTEHQIIQGTEVASDGRTLQRGAIDLWQDGDGARYLRRVYDSRHHLVAAKWRNKSGEHRSQFNGADKERSRSNLGRFIERLWDQELSARSFQSLEGSESRIAPINGGYELTTVGPVKGRPELISVSLVFDSHLHPIRQVMRVHVGSEVHELRFVQASFERSLSSSVPDAVFDPGYGEAHAGQGADSSMNHPGENGEGNGSSQQLAELQIAVLYRLNQLGADIGQPIEVARTQEGHLRVSGAIADAALRREIVAHLESLPGHALLEVKLISPREMQPAHAQPETAEDTSVYEVGAAKPIVDASLRRYFAAKGLSGAGLEQAIAQYSHDALLHSQRALQNAYALDRLGSSLSAAEFPSIGAASRQQWAEMTRNHATDLEEQLRALRGQLSEILPAYERTSDPAGPSASIEDAAQFRIATGAVLRQTQDLNRDIGRLFTSNLSVEPSSALDTLILSSVTAIPMRQTEEIAHFAVKLKSAGLTAQPDSSKHEDDEGTTREPR